ncbi:subfamily C [Mactra antiquata]
MATLILRQAVLGRNLTHVVISLPQSFGAFSNKCCIHISTAKCVGYKLKSNISDCYSLLNLNEGCTMEELKQAYFEKAKMYHPDSMSTMADPKKFSQVKEAYKTIKTKLIEDEDIVDNDDDDDDYEHLFRPRQLQHRQFLDNEGFGYGSKSQRQKQYDQYRVHRAQDSVYDYKVTKVMPEGDNALVAKDQKAARKTKMSNSMDRLVEDMIQESMSRGDFDNLSGKGKPLDFTREVPYMDKISHKLNEILVKDDVQPDWIMKQKEIRTDLKKFRETLAKERKRFEIINVKDNDTQKMWNRQINNLKENLSDINSKIQDYNLIVPILTNQMMPYDFDREYNRVCSNVEHYLPDDFYTMSRSSTGFTSYKDNSDLPTLTPVRSMIVAFKEVFMRK